MFGMGLWELAVIAAVAVMVFGPDRIPELAKQAGAFVKQGRKMANSARDELRAELGPEYADLQLRDLDPRTLVRKHILDVIDEGDDEPDAGKRQSTARLGEGALPPYDDEAT
jgi:sec-independent protein translocase protein TatB